MNSPLTPIRLLVIGDAQADAPFVTALRGLEAVACITCVEVTADDSEDQIECLLQVSGGEINRFQAVIICVKPIELSLDLLESFALPIWRTELRHQLRLPFMVCKAVLKQFLFDGGPKSMLLLLPTPDESDVIHFSTHQGLSALIRTIGKEYGSRGIHCNGIDYPQRLIDQPATLDPLLKTIRLLISPDASLINGEILQLNEQSIRRLA